MAINLTEKRKRIFHILKRAEGTLSASDVHQKLPDIDLVTIYRNLDLFVRERMIKQVNLDTDEAQYEYQREPHHHAICANCDRVMHFTLPDEKLKKMLKLKGFDVEEIEVTVRGVCRG